MKPRGLQPQAWVTTRVLRTFLRRLAKWRMFHISVVDPYHAVPEKGGAVIIANHLSYSDPPIIWACIKRIVVTIAMKELWRSPMVVIMVALGHIPIDRGNPKSAVKARKRMIKVVRAGGLLLGFPEGKISKTGEQLPFKSGLFDTAIEAKVPVIPVGIAGSNDLWPIGSKHIHRKRHVVVAFGQPLYRSDYPSREAFIEAGETAVAKLSEEAREYVAEKNADE